jgi:hypothetical protein
MINLDALDNDPWPTTPVKKEDLRALAHALENAERGLKVVMMDAKVFHAALTMIATQAEEPASRRAARRALGWEPVKDTGLIL